MFDFEIHLLKTWQVNARGELLHFLIPALILIALSALYYFCVNRSVRDRSWPNLREFIFPRTVFSHASCRIDMMMISLSALLWRPLISVVTSTLVGMNVRRGLNAYLGSDAPMLHSPLLILTVQAITWLLSIQFAFYVMHRLAHTTEWLWRFHRVHHSSEALNFMTAGRIHPLEPLFFDIPISLTSGVALGLLLHFTGVPLSSALPATEAILLVVRGVANSIHHSHFAQSFGKLDYVFVSARMHQIHHSAELRHRDRNFGGFLSIYDWMLGTLYLPGKDEKFRVGLNENELGERNPHQRLRDCYLEPFGFHGQRLSARKHLTDNAI